MKKCFFLLILSTLLTIIILPVSSKEPSNYFDLKFIDGYYILYEDNCEIAREESLLPLISKINGARVYFDNVRIFENLNLSDICAEFSGNLFCDNEAKITVDKGASLVFFKLNIKLLTEDSAVILSGGNLIVNSSVIEASGDTAIYSRGAESALCILNDSNVRAVSYDIVSDSGVSFIGEFGEQYDNDQIFNLKYIGEKNTFSDIIKIGENMFPPINLYNASDENIPIHQLIYVNEFSKTVYDYRLEGERAALPEGDRIFGYDFSGWSIENEIVTDIPSVSSSVTLFAQYKMSPPLVCINDIEFTYDGKYRILKPGRIMHPFVNDYKIYYKWYCGEKVVSENEELVLRDVDDTGEYKLEMIFVNDNGDANTFFEYISVDIKPRKLYLSYKDDKFQIVSGDIVNGDKVDIREMVTEGKIEAVTENPNYCLEFSSEITENKDTQLNVIAWSVVILSVISAIAYLVFCSAEKDSHIKAIGHTAISFSEDPFVKSREESGELREVFFGVDAIKADELLSDHLAKNMIDKGGCIYTGGDVKCSVMLGAVNERFFSGERVDINEMKKRGLIPDNAKYIKITSEGIIDKPLQIFANDFDITAVKMITLSGGEAIKVKSKRKL